MSSESSTSQEVILSPSARTALTREVGFFGDLLPRDLQTRMDFLNTVQPSPFKTSPFDTALKKVSGVSQSATRTAGEARELDQNEISRSIMLQAERDPELRARLLALADQIFGQTQAIVDPRFAQFLKPNVSSSTSPSSLSTGLAIGGTAASVGLGIAAIA